MTEVKAENNEIKEESVITPVPPEEELSPTPEPVVEVIREQRIIVPKVILPPAIDPEIEAVLLEEEDENDLNQHFFIDQVHWQRPTWGNSWWFGRCAMIALAVDMSAIQSFPRHVANQGGIIFIVMYVLCLCVFGYPGVVFEGLIGQHFQTGMLGIWGLVPLLRGIGVAVFSSSLVFAALAPSNVMWSAIMMIDSCKALATGHLPWESCNNKWNSCHCKGIRKVECPPINGTRYTPAFEYYLGRVLKLWKTQYGNPKEIHDFTQNGDWSRSYGFHNHQDGLGELQFLPGVIALSVFLAILILVSVDTKYSGYVYTVTSLYPLLALTILFCRGITLQGAVAAVRKYLAPDFSKLLSIKAWYLALQTSLYSLGLGVGLYVSIGSCNPLHHNLLADAMTVIVADTLTSLLSCVVLYSFMGHYYYYQNEELRDTFTAISPAFVEIPDALSVITGSVFFAVIYFVMLTIIASDTIIVSLQFLTYSLFEEYKRKYPDQAASSRLFSMPVIGFAFGCALLCVTRGGYWMYLFLGNVFTGINLIFIIMVQEFAFSYIFGLDDISIAYETIVGQRPGLHFRICWKFVRPIATFIMFMEECINRSLHSYHITAFDSGLSGPKELEYFGAAFDCVYLVFIIAYAGYEFSKVVKYKGKKPKTCKQKALFLISPEYDRERILEEPSGAKRGHLKHWLYFNDPRDPSVKDQVKEIFMSAKETFKKLISKLKRKPNRTSDSTQDGDYTIRSKRGKKSHTEHDESAWEIMDKVRHSIHQPQEEVLAEEQVAPTPPLLSSDSSSKKKQVGKENVRKNVRKKTHSDVKPYV